MYWFTLAGLLLNGLLFQSVISYDQQVLSRIRKRDGVSGNTTTWFTYTKLRPLCHGNRSFFLLVLSLSTLGNVHKWCLIRRRVGGSKMTLKYWTDEGKRWTLSGEEGVKNYLQKSDIIYARSLTELSILVQVLTSISFSYSRQYLLIIRDSTLELESSK